MQRHDGRRSNGRVTEQRAIPITPNSVCPLPLIGWKPRAASRIVTGDAETPDAPPLMQCIQHACAWFVVTQGPTAEAPYGTGNCALAAIAVITAGLPAAMDHYARGGAAPLDERPHAIPDAPSVDPSAENEAPPPVESQLE